jgi:hypothetical protein
MITLTADQTDLLVKVIVGYLLVDALLAILVSLHHLFKWIKDTITECNDLSALAYAYPALTNDEIVLIMKYYPRNPITLANASTSTGIAQKLEHIVILVKRIDQFVDTRQVVFNDTVTKQTIWLLCRECTDDQLANLKTGELEYAIEAMEERLIGRLSTELFEHVKAE